MGVGHVRTQEEAPRRPVWNAIRLQVLPKEIPPIQKSQGPLSREARLRHQWME